MDVRGKDILVPIDFTMAARYGISSAVNLARRLKTDLHLVNFIPPAKQKNVHTAESREAVGDALTSSINLLKENQEKLTKLMDNFEKGDLSIHSEIKMDKFANGVKKQIKNKNIGLIVMGINGHWSIGDALSENKQANDIIRSGCPVMVCNEHAVALQDTSSIVVSMDADSYLGENFDKFLNVTHTLFNTWHFLHVNHTGDKKKWTLQGLRSFLKKHNMPQASVRIMESEDKEEAIIKYAEEKGAGCIAVNRHGKASSFKDCHVDQVVAQSHYPVFIY